MNLGFSLYPDQHSLATMTAYIERLCKYPFRRVFLSLLQLDTSDRLVMVKYQAIIQLCKQHQLMVIADINQALIEQLGWQEDLITQAKVFGLDGLRLDEALELSAMIKVINNNQDFRIELNISQDNHMLDYLLKNGARKDNLIGCHNFYPKRFTGLSKAHFIKTTRHYQAKGILSAAFITAETASEGPWPVSEGLPTLEDHRDRLATSQLKELIYQGLIDDVIISNQFVSDEELQAIVAAFTTERQLSIEVVDDLTEAEAKIIAYDHHYRNDISEYVLRSTMTRIVYQDEDIPSRQQAKLVKRGDILIDNNFYGRYKGELQIALRDFEASSKTNIVGHILASDLPLLDYLQANDAFKLIVSRQGQEIKQVSQA